MTNQTPADTTDDLLDALGDDETLQQVKDRSINGVVSYFIRTLFLQGIGLASAIILSALLKPSDFGIYGIVIQIIGLLTFFSDVGLAAALIRDEKQPSIVDYRTAFTVQHLLGWLIVAVALAIGSTSFFATKAGEAGFWILVSLAISFPLASLKTIPSIILERKLDFSRLVIPQIVEQIVFHGVVIWCAVVGYGALSYAYAIVARSVMGVMVMLAIQRWSFGFGLNRNSLRRLLHFGVQFQLNDFLARIKDQLFYLALGLYFSPTTFGYIQWAKQWSMYPYNLTVQNMMAVTFPAFSRLQHNPAALRRAIEKALFFISLITFPMLVGMSVFVLPLVEIIPQYQQWQPALWLLIVFSLSIGWSAITTPLINTLNALGHVDKTLRLMILWTILTWLVTPLMIWLFDYNGVAIAAFIIASTSVIAIRYVKRYIEVAVWRAIWRPLTAAIVLAVYGTVLLPLWSSSITWWLLGMISSGCIYLLAVWLIAREQLISEGKSLYISKIKPYLAVFSQKRYT